MKILFIKKKVKNLRSKLSRTELNELLKKMKNEIFVMVTTAKK